MSHNATNTAEDGKQGGFSLRWVLHSPLALPLIGLIVVSILMGFASENFFSVGNIMNVLRQVSIVAILAVGMTFVILTGGIDLSVGAVMALSGTIAAGLMVNMGLPGWVGLLAGLGVGVGLGIFNGVTCEDGCPPNGDPLFPDDVWGAQEGLWGQRYGGVSSAEDCAALPAPAVAGCQWRFASEGLRGADNPAATYTRVACRPELYEKSGCLLAEDVQ